LQEESIQPSAISNQPNLLWAAQERVSET